MTQDKKTFLEWLGNTKKPLELSTEFWFNPGGFLMSDSESIFWEKAVQKMADDLPEEYSLFL